MLWGLGTTGKDSRHWDSEESWRLGDTKKGILKGQKALGCWSEVALSLGNTTGYWESWGQ